MKKRVLLRGGVLTQSGYGHHCRQIARWLIEKHDKGEIDLSIQALPWGMTPWIIDETRENGLIGKIMARTVNPTGVYDFTFQVQLPNEWDPKLGRYNVGITAGVEADKCNPQWKVCCSAMSKVVVPSTFVKKILDGESQNSNIVVIPESFPDTLKNSNEIKYPQPLSDIKTDFNFLMVGQLTGNSPENDRKNTFFAIKWFCELFADDPNVGLIIKTNSGKNTKIDRNVTLNVFKQIAREVRKDVNPKLYLLHGDMSNSEMNALYRHPRVKCLLTATRGEGFGLPILEAAVAGLPVIATNWSGHLDFMDKGKFIKLNYELKPVPQSRIDGSIFMPGSNWAEVNEHDFKLKLTKLYKSHSIPRDWAKELSAKLQVSHSFAAIAKLYDTEFKDLTT